MFRFSHDLSGSHNPDSDSPDPEVKWADQSRPQICSPTLTMQQQPMKLTPGPYSAVGLAILGAITVLIANLALGLSGLDIGARELIDTDGYMRYSRILDLVQGRNGWFDGWIYWSNSPFGHSMHWTRPLDALVLLLATPIAPFVGWSDAVYWAALLTGPIIHVSLAGVVMWGAWRIMPPQAAALAGWIAGLQPIITGYSLVGRLDHHVLVTVLALAILGATLASFPSRLQSATLAGCLSGVALWVSPEALLIVGISAATLAFLWVIRGGPVKALWWWSAAFMLTVIIAILLEKGLSDILSIEYDRISLPYLVAAVSGFFGLTTLLFVLQRQPTWQISIYSRLALLVSSILIPGVLTAVIFPGLLNGPFAQTPKRIWDIWLSSVSESQPLWSGETPLSSTVFHLATPVVGLACAFLLVQRQSKSQKALWVTIAAWLALMIPLALSSTRLALYPQALAGFPVAAVAWSAIMRWGRGPSIGRIVVRSGFICASVSVYAISAVAAYALEGEKPGVSGFTIADCQVTELADEISHQLGVDGTILANIDLGPMLHVASGRHVIATPHHRNVDGILDAYDIMRSPPNEARKSIHMRGIDAVVICPPVDSNYLSPIPKGSLYQILLDNDVPPWLQKVDIDTLESHLFLVRP